MFVRWKRKKIRYNRTENGRPMGCVFIYWKICVCTHTHNKKTGKMRTRWKAFSVAAMRRNAHALVIIDDDERNCARPVSIFNFSPPAGLLSAIWAFDFFLYLPELLWNTQRIYPPIFFVFRRGLHNKAIGWSAGLHKHVMKSDWW